jgi:hypothetical protein
MHEEGEQQLHGYFGSPPTTPRVPSHRMHRAGCKSSPRCPDPRASGRSKPSEFYFSQSEGFIVSGVSIMEEASAI